LAEALVALDSTIRPFFVGAQKGIEARVLPERGIDHVLFPLHGIDRRTITRVLSGMAGVAGAIPALGQLFLRLRPELVVLTGGYAAAPAGVTASLMGIPVILQEQNSVPGITTRLLSPLARRVHVAFPEVVERLPRWVSRRVRLTGNPVPRPSTMEPGEARALFGLPAHGRVVLVVGGSQGSAALNEATLDLLRTALSAGRRWPEDVAILWSTGPTHYDGIRQALAELGSPPWVRAFGFIDRIQEAMAASDLAISRAGAMTTSGIVAACLPSILVPLPTAAADHQTQNARSLESSGAARILDEAQLSGVVLLDLLIELLDSPSVLSAMRRAAGRVASPDAARLIAGDCLSFLQRGV